MGGSSSYVCWRQPWSDASESLLRTTLYELDAPVQDLSSQLWDPKTSTIGGIRDYKLSTIGTAGASWSFILLHNNSLIGEALAERISNLQDGPTFLFMEFEQTTWGYSLFREGRLLDHFWSDPENIGELLETCKGDSRVLGDACRVAPSALNPYLREARTLVPGEKAFADDEFVLEDHWVRVDFMRRLGIEYPNPANHRHVLVKETIGPHSSFMRSAS